MGALRTNVIGFDDGPFFREHRGDVPLVGVVCARTRVDGVVMGKVRRDGANATSAIASLLLGSPFDGHVQAVLLQGIAVAGFNVVDIHALAHEVGRPVVVVARRAPDLPSIRRALFARVPGAARKWRLRWRATSAQGRRGGVGPGRWLACTTTCATGSRSPRTTPTPPRARC